MGEEGADRICTSHREGNGASELDNGLAAVSRALFSATLTRSQKACLKKISERLPAARPESVHISGNISIERSPPDNEAKAAHKISPPGGEFY